MNEITKYHNDLNTISTKGWTAEEMDFFFLIITRLKEQGCKRLTFSKEELTKAAGYTGEHNERLRARLEHLVQNVGGLNYLYRSKTKTALWHMFNVFEINWTDDMNDFTATVEIAPKFEYLVNLLEANFTKFEFMEFSEIRGTYAKTLYRLLKQFRTTGMREFNADDFRFLMGVPDSYKSNAMGARVLKPCMKELANVFPGLTYKTIKKNTKGNPVIGYRFTWTPETRNTWIDGQPVQKRQAIEAKKSGLPDWYSDMGETGPTDDLLAEIERLRAKV